MEPITIGELEDDADRVGVELVGADAIGLQLELRMTGSRFVECRFSGADFANSVLDNMTFDSCILSGASFRFARMRNVRFENCRLDETEFSNAKLRDVVMERCHIEATEFSHVQIEHLDLRTSTILSAHGVQFLANATVDELQASALGPQLAQAIGIKVEPAGIDTRPKPIVVDDRIESDDDDVSPPPHALEHLSELRQQLLRPKP